MSFNENTYWNSKGNIKKHMTTFIQNWFLLEVMPLRQKESYSVLWVSFTTDTVMMETTIGIW